MRYHLLLLSLLSFSHGFFIFKSSPPVLRRGRYTASTNSDNEETDDVHEEKEESMLVTREILQRAMLEGGGEDLTPTVKRKKRNGSHYRILDNRDSLPFTVKVVTPDPYTKPAQKRYEAQKNTKLNQEKSKKKVHRKIDLVNLANGGSSVIAASLFNKMNDGSLEKVVGEFHLDRNTNCGDIIEVGENDYEVVKARCQYKYAGGKRFVMVRKVLEVKDVTRIAQENYLKRQFYNNTDEIMD